MVTKNEHLSRSHCPLAHCLDIVGDHWTLLIVRDLLLGKHEFQEFQSSPEGISSNILSNRLKKLQEQDVIRWITHPENKKRKLYYLTTKGKELLYVIGGLMRWSLKYMPGDKPVPGFVADIADNPAQARQEILQTLQAWETEYNIENG
ncbi:helix-turn-helix domain-containing protein [Pseudomaricurvus sp. HS19]|uniref:winged helix-turn-helix transcriptional regulator n=1 Tax=Pseudomaricurvus sp. HS19 TaxID=2692626 RepID=UPI00136928C7|nr:helix-turn-helix domain-containing protein [Pseudomaricurvus sp. HS19]MYM64438.1 transcriptional regulator [Pseudomaricurvus sp. HS19]